MTTMFVLVIAPDSSRQHPWRELWVEAFTTREAANQAETAWEKRGYAVERHEVVVDQNDIPAEPEPPPPRLTPAQLAILVERLQAEGFGVEPLRPSPAWTNRMRIRSPRSGNLYEIGQLRSGGEQFGEWRCSCLAFKRKQRCWHTDLATDLSREIASTPISGPLAGPC
jgi:hypothetical protein